MHGRDKTRLKDVPVTVFVLVGNGWQKQISGKGEFTYSGTELHLTLVNATQRAAYRLCLPYQLREPKGIICHAYLESAKGIVAVRFKNPGDLVLFQDWMANEQSAGTAGEDLVGPGPSSGGKGSSADPAPSHKTKPSGHHSRDKESKSSGLVLRPHRPSSSVSHQLPARIGCHLREHQKPFLASLNFVSTVVRVRKLNHYWVGSVIMTRIAGTSPDIFALLIMHAPSLGELLVVNNVHYNGLEIHNTDDYLDLFPVVKLRDWDSDDEDQALRERIWSDIDEGVKILGEALAEDFEFWSSGDDHSEGGKGSRDSYGGPQLMPLTAQNLKIFDCVNSRGRRWNRETLTNLFKGMDDVPADPTMVVGGMPSEVEESAYSTDVGQPPTSTTYGTHPDAPRMIRASGGGSHLRVVEDSPAAIGSSPARHVSPDLVDDLKEQLMCEWNLFHSDPPAAAGGGKAPPAGSSLPKEHFRGISPDMHPRPDATPVREAPHGAPHGTTTKHGTGGNSALAPLGLHGDDRGWA